MPYTTVNGCDIYYEAAGDGPPLAFIHGGFGGLGTGAGGAQPGWHEGFAKKMRVVTYDRRSSGRSGYPTTAHTMDVFADDLAGVLDALGIDKAAVWGTSAGGPIAMSFALRHPQRTASLIVTETSPMFFPDPETRRKLKERIAVLMNDGPEAAYEARRAGGTVGLNLFAADRPAVTAEEEEQRKARRARIQAQLAQVPPEERIAKYAGELRNYSAYADMDLTERFFEIAAPTLVVQGTADSVFPNVPWAAYVARKGKAELMELPGGEHGSVPADDACLARILGFALAHA